MKKVVKTLIFFSKKLSLNRLLVNILRAFISIFLRIIAAYGEMWYKYLVFFFSNFLSNDWLELINNLSKFLSYTS